MWDRVARWLAQRAETDRRFAIGYGIGCGAFVASAALFVGFAVARGDPFKWASGTPRVVIAAFFVAGFTWFFVPLLIERSVHLSRVRRTLRRMDTIGR